MILFSAFTNSVVRLASLKSSMRMDLSTFLRGPSTFPCTQLLQRKNLTMKRSILCSSAMPTAKKMRAVDCSCACSLCLSIFLLTFFLISFTSLG